MALTEKIYFFQWDDLDAHQDTFCEHYKCHQARVFFFFSPWYHHHILLKSCVFYLARLLKWNHLRKSWQQQQKNFMAPFYGWGSTASRLQPLRGGSFLSQSLEKECYEGMILFSVTETFVFGLSDLKRLLITSNFLVHVFGKAL